MLFEIFLFSLVVTLIILFYTNNLLLTALLIIAWLVGIRFWHKKHDIYFFVAGAVIGSIAEIICIYFGVWQYANPTFLGIPMWLPIVWGLAAMLIKRTGETLAKIGAK
ncbi:MAG: DUF2878 family protein [Candidatus Aenigmarchaeota archaeon]|nr:DUF2878 family protein [Candidatus Aenigmarchaeota archaeon]NIQ17886.1 DUF2878 family protein [Candidatus Aenigmarchaeota archaeon]